MIVPNIKALITQLAALFSYDGVDFTQRNFSTIRRDTTVRKRSIIYP